MDQIFNNLTHMIKEHNHIVIMTHKNPDFDGIGSALALQSIIASFKKESIILKSDKSKNKSLEKAYQYLDDYNIPYTVGNKMDVRKFITDESILIILDTHKQEMVEDESLLKLPYIIIDHHIRSKNYIKDSKLTYINATLSSTVEFIVNYLRYLNKSIPSLLATYLLVGIEIDTNNFKLKTTETTYEAAAHLARLGADNILKQELLQETKQDYIKRQKLIEKSIMITDNMALCVADNHIYQKKDLAAIAEELLQFENVEASFAIGKISNNKIGISARSLGKINVEQIMQKLGGGGHMTEAATELKENIAAGERQLLEVIGGTQ